MSETALGSAEAHEDGEPYDVETTDGRVPGQRGRATRSRLLEATIEVVSQTPWRSVRVIDIAKVAGTSPATFYQYFENVEAAIRVLAEEMVAAADDLAGLVHGDWSDDESWETALTLSEGFIEFWEANRAVFRVVDLATEEGVAELKGVRVRALNAVTVALAQEIAQLGPRGSRPSPASASPAGVDPMAVASTLIAMFINVAAYRYGFEFWGIRTRDLIDSEARFLHWAVTGRPGPPGLVGRAAAGARPVQRPRTGPTPGGAVVAHRSSRRHPG